MCYNGTWEKIYWSWFCFDFVRKNGTCLFHQLLWIFCLERNHVMWSPKVLLIHVLICFIHSVWSKNKLHYSFTLLLPVHVSFLWFISLVLIHDIPLEVETWGCIYGLGCFQMLVEELHTPQSHHFILFLCTWFIPTHGVFLSTVLLGF